MKLQDLKEWVNQLPEEFLEFEVVNAEEGQLTESEEDYWYRLDRPIVSCDVDEESKEVLLLSDPNPKN